MSIIFLLRLFHQDCVKRASKESWIRCPKKRRTRGVLDFFCVLLLLKRECRTALYSPSCFPLKQDRLSILFDYAALLSSHCADIPYKFLNRNGRPDTTHLIRSRLYSFLLVLFNIAVDSSVLDYLTLAYTVYTLR